MQRGEGDEVTEAAKRIFDSGKNPMVRLSLAILSKLLLRITFDCYSIQNMGEAFLGDKFH